MGNIKQFLKFEPILKEKIWGGTKLINLLNKNSKKENIGESWEVSGVKDTISIVSNGALYGKDLQELIRTYRSSFLGEKVYALFGEKFPLLVKFIDAKKALSIQVHPNDNQAKYKHNSLGKTEMWYIMQADKEANIVVGFKKDSNKKEYLHHLNKKSLLEILNVDEINEGDVYFIPAGRVHAIGAGVLLAEIQETSDVTYRIYDWDRKDAKGITRELHTDNALEVIDFSSKNTYKTKYSKVNNETSSLVSCQYFTTNFLALDELLEVSHDKKDSFIVYMCVKGSADFLSDFGKEEIKKGQTLVVPASLKNFKINPSEKVELLEVYIK